MSIRRGDLEEILFLLVFVYCPETSGCPNRCFSSGVKKLAMMRRTEMLIIHDDDADGDDDDDNMEEVDHDGL